MQQQVLSDVISRINVAKRGHFSIIKIPNTNLSRSLMSVLEEIGVIRGYTVIEHTNYIEVMLKYYKSKCIFHEFKQISTPGRRWRVKLVALARMKERGNKVIYIVSTSKGLMLDSECLRLRICGEVILKVVL